MNALDDRSLGWLRYLHRKATTPDNWIETSHPHPHWDETTGEPMTSWHRFDLVDSSYAVALMCDRTPAWREVYSTILDELVARHTSWWSASDWMTQFGHDPERGNYPDRYRPLVPPAHWGDYDVPGWTANGIAPYGVQPDPIAADGMLFYKGFLHLTDELAPIRVGRRQVGSTFRDDPGWREHLRLESLECGSAFGRAMAQQSDGLPLREHKGWPY